MVGSEWKLIGSVAADLMLVINILQRLPIRALVRVHKISGAHCFTPDVTRRVGETVGQTTRDLKVQRVIRRILVVPVERYCRIWGVWSEDCVRNAGMARARSFARRSACVLRGRVDGAEQLTIAAIGQERTCRRIHTESLGAGARRAIDSPATAGQGN